MNKKIKEIVDRTGIEAAIAGYGIEFLKVNYKTRVVRVKAGAEWEGYKWHILTLDDLARYVRVESGNISSGCRRVGTIVGDWRLIDQLAKFLWNEIFVRLYSEDECRNALAKY